jgi:hypothetical protein
MHYADPPRDFRCACDACGDPSRALAFHVWPHDRQHYGYWCWCFAYCAHVRWICVSACHISTPRRTRLTVQGDTELVHGEIKSGTKISLREDQSELLEERARIGQKHSLFTATRLSFMSRRPRCRKLLIPSREDIDAPLDSIGYGAGGWLGSRTMRLKAENVLGRTMTFACWNFAFRLKRENRGKGLDG